MNADIVVLASQALSLAFRVSLPAVLASAVVGVLVSLLQAVTHIQDQSMPFLLKLGATIAALLVAGYWMFGEIDRFTYRVFDTIEAVGANGSPELFGATRLPTASSDHRPAVKPDANLLFDRGVMPRSHDGAAP